MTIEEINKIAPYEATEWQQGYGIWQQGYMQGQKDATEQKAIDEEDYTEQMRQLNEEWKENLAIQRKMLIDKATEWFANYLFEIGYPDGWVRDNGVWLNGAKRFQKDMGL